MREREGGRVYQIAQFIGCASLLSTPGWGKVFSGDFTMNLTPHYRALSSALQIEKLKRPLDSELEILRHMARCRQFSNAKLQWPQRGGVLMCLSQSK